MPLATDISPPFVSLAFIWQNHDLTGCRRGAPAARAETHVARWRPLRKDVSSGTSGNCAGAGPAARAASAGSPISGPGEGAWESTAHHRHRLHACSTGGLRRRLLLARVPRSPHTSPDQLRVVDVESRAKPS